MERLKELAENLITQVTQQAEKRVLFETVIQMLRELTLEGTINTPEIMPPVQTIESSVEKSVNAENPSLNEVLRGVEEDLSVRLTHSNIHSLKEAIGINDRFVFVEKLFGNSIGRFEKVLDQMDKAGSYEASEQVLINELTLNMPEDASPALIDQLLSLVRRRFPSK